MSKILSKSQTTEQATSILRQAKFKATPGRIELLSVLMLAGRPLSVEQIIKKLSKQSLNSATVYRAVSELKNGGLLRQIDFQHGHAHYELGSLPDHHHIVCQKCGRVEELLNCHLQPLINIALHQTKNFKSISQHTFELFGICKSCNKPK